MFCQKLLNAFNIRVFDRSTELVLYGKWLNQEGLEETLTLLPQLRSLHSVQFVDVEIDDVQLNRLQREMPNCKIEKLDY